MRDLTLFLVALMLGAGLFVLHNRIYGGPEPRAGLYCTPVVVEAGQPVRCHDLSPYATRVEWDPDDGKLNRISPNHGPVELRFDRPGKREISLTAFQGGARDKATTIVEVVESQAMQYPVMISMSVETDSKRQQIETPHKIDVVKDDHPNRFDADVQAYEYRFDAEPGYQVDGVRMQMRSTSSLVGLRSRTLPDRSAAMLEFSLRSGPQADPYRGWFRGEIVVIQSAAVDGEAMAVLEEFTIDRYGDYSLPRINLDGVSRISFLDSEGEIYAAGRPGEEMVARDGRISFRLQDQEHNSLLTVTRRRPEEVFE